MDLNTEKIGRLVRELLIEIGEDPAREGLLNTPQRVAKALAFLTSGYRTDVKELINGACFAQETSSMVIVRDIEVYSMCEHHLVPFFGKAHIGYIPNVKGEITGLSKLARLADVYARRPQVQERMTCQIADALMRILEPRGVIVVLECEHLCMFDAVAQLTTAHLFICGFKRIEYLVVGGVADCV